MITTNQLQTYLANIEEQYPEEWRLPYQQPERYWKIEYIHSRPPFEFLIEFNEDMLYIQYQPRDFQINAKCYLSLYRILLQLNEKISLVKFGLTPAGNISFMGELPGTLFSLDSFQNLLRLMVYYLEQLYWEINLAASSPELADFITGHHAHSPVPDEEIQSLAQRIEVEKITSLSAKEQGYG